MCQIYRYLISPVAEILLHKSHNLRLNEFGSSTDYDAARCKHFKFVLDRRHPGLLNGTSYSYHVANSNLIIDT
jgi:hypothetical protein